MISTVTDWDSMGHVIMQTFSQAYQTLGRFFQTLDQDFNFQLRIQKLGRVFESLGYVV